MKGRPPLSPEQRRSEVIRMRVRASARQRFVDLCHERGLTQSEALREALNMWIKKNGSNQ